MSVLTAAVVLAWGCLAVLTLAMAGMLRQVRELQADVARLGAPPSPAAMGRQIPQLAGAGHLVLLVLDPGCSFCDAVHEPFTRLAGAHPGTRFEVLSPRTRWADASAPVVRFRVDQGLVTELELPWAPALLHVDTDGTVLAGQPVRSAERLGEQVANLLATEAQRQGAS
ncbi:MAG: hypothetical protein ACRDS9_23055 [Pseudonocardiaceae bacterium]